MAYSAERIKVLFVCSGNNKINEVSPFIKAQAISLEQIGVEVDFYIVKGKGIWGYLKQIKPLYKTIRRGKYSNIHAHYSYCGYIAGICSKKVIVSLLGSDIQINCLQKLVLKFFYHFRWEKLIIKTEKMKESLGLKRALVIPNGIDIKKFVPIERNEAKEKVGFSKDKIQLLFLAAPNRHEKNYSLAYEAVKLLNNPILELIVVESALHSMIPYYINAARVVVLSSKWEGSPNVVKEAMSCNISVVSTRVGDVEWLFGNLNGYYIAESEPNDFARMLDQALNNTSSIHGRERIIELELDSISVARKIEKIYRL